MEPSLTLGTYRKHPKVGVLFGMYYQMEMLHNQDMFKWVCPAGLKYETYDTATEEHPIVTDSLG